MKVGDLVRCDDWVFGGITGIITELLYSGPTKVKGWPPSGAQIYTSTGLRRVSIHNIKVISESR